MLPVLVRLSIDYRGRLETISPAASVNLVDHVLELRLGRVLPERPHDGTELLGGDGAIAVLRWGLCKGFRPPCVEIDGPNVSQRQPEP